MKAQRDISLTELSILLLSPAERTEAFEALKKQKEGRVIATEGCSRRSCFDGNLVLVAFSSGGGLVGPRPSCHSPYEQLLEKVGVGIFVHVPKSVLRSRFVSPCNQKCGLLFSKRLYSENPITST